MYVQHSIEERSCNRCCSVKAMNITQSVFVIVALGIQHAMHMRHIVINCLSRSTILLHFISYTVRFAKKNVIKHKMFVYSLTFV
jgi:hypothetical protein